VKELWGGTSTPAAVEEAGSQRPARQPQHRLRRLLEDTVSSGSVLAGALCSLPLVLRTWCVWWNWRQTTERSAWVPGLERPWTGRVSSRGGESCTWPHRSAQLPRGDHDNELTEEGIEIQTVKSFHQGHRRWFSAQVCLNAKSSHILAQVTAKVA